MRSTTLATPRTGYPIFAHAIESQKSPTLPGAPSFAFLAKGGIPRDPVNAVLILAERHREWEISRFSPKNTKGGFAAALKLS